MPDRGGSGISRRTLINISTGKYRGDLKTWMILARTWGMSLDGLLASAWDDDDSATQAAAVHNRVELAWGDESADSDSDEADGPPPQSGPGASRRLWAEYAQAHDVVVEAAWKRDDIIAACQRAGIAV